MGRDPLSTRREDLSWASAYLDGEGALILKKNGRGIEISVHSVDPRAIQRLLFTFGGAVSYEPRRKPHQKDQFRWRVYGEHARDVVREILDEVGFVVKQEQAEVLRYIGDYPVGSAMHLSLREKLTKSRQQEYYGNGSPRR